MKYASYLSPPGPITLASDGEALTGLWFQGQKHYPDLTGWQEEDLPVFAQARAWLDAYFRRQVPGPPPPLRPAGTAFQKEVWAILAAIPYGVTRTYADIAGELARRKGLSKMSARAVGGAVGKNPISLIIPCHRVVGKSGRLTGYAGGLDRKGALLELEGALNAM